MYLLPCSQCQQPISVSSSQAGDTAECPNCGQSVVIPKLGELKKLPRSDASTHDVEQGSRSTFGQRIAFSALSLVATISLLIAAFCGVQWLTVDVPLTTEEHVDEVRQQYAKLPAANLVREYEDIERYAVDIAAPLPYRVAELTRQRWGRNAIIALALGLLAAVGAMAVAMFGGHAKGKAAPDT